MLRRKDNIQMDRSDVRCHALGSRKGQVRCRALVQVAVSFGFDKTQEIS